MRSWLYTDRLQEVTPLHPRVVAGIAGGDADRCRRAQQRRDKTFAELDPDLIDRADAAEVILAQARATESPILPGKGNLAARSPSAHGAAQALLREAEAAADMIVDARAGPGAGAARGEAPWSPCACWTQVPVGSSGHRSPTADRALNPGLGSRSCTRRPMPPRCSVWLLRVPLRFPTRATALEGLRLLGESSRGCPAWVDELLKLCAAIHHFQLHRGRALGQYGRILLDAHGRMAGFSEDANSVLVPVVLAALLADANLANEDQTGDERWRPPSLPTDRGQPRHTLAGPATGHG